MAAERAAAGAGTVDFLGIGFDTHGRKWMTDAIRARPPDQPFAYVVTPNVDHLVRLHRTRPDLWPAYRQAWGTLCDSRILGRLAAMAGVRIPVVPGSDLTADLFRSVIDRHDRIAFLGADQTAISVLSARYGLSDVRHHNPPMGFIHDPVEVARAVEFLTGCQARYCFLAVGSPQQELIAYLVAKAGRATGIGLCIGASLDFLTGAQRRAPAAMQRLSLEWLFRLGSNPRRLWRRYLVEGPTILSVFRDWRRNRSLTRPGRT